MAETPTVYVICDKNCRFEGMTKEQIFTAIKQAVESGEIKDVDAGFITTIKTINGTPLKFFVGEQAAYDELSDAEKENLFAIITNDVTKEGLLDAIEALQTEYEDLYNALFINGSKSVKSADSAQKLAIAPDIYISKVGTEGVNIAAERGRGYLILARFGEAANVFETMFFYYGVEASIVSTLTREGNYAWVVNRSTGAALYFENSEGQKIIAEDVYLRAI